MNFLKKIWPTVYKVINEIIFFIVSVIKGIFHYALRQIENK
ncbi:MAG TPA: hypothetical protein VKC89_01230 [Patescibacteria group bacterium]|nr:hypothetical protein [Patescibacteria group bacterium]